MDMPTLRTERLILRKFTENDLEALFRIYSDVVANEFLPWFPLKTMEDARTFYNGWFDQEHLSRYAICLKKDNVPIGYVNVSTNECYDFGYGLRKEFWHQGIATEAGRAVIEQLRKNGIPYITATHDVNNPRSGGVMRKLGMSYQYSYQEQWQPKNISVIFRMYQLNLDENTNRVYKGYWNQSSVHFVEDGI